MRLIEQILALKHCCQNREEELRENLDLTLSEYNCLSSFPEESHITARDLAGLMHLSPSRLSRVADALVRRGYLARSTDPLDRRIQLYALTPAGLEVKLGIRKLLDECEAGLKAHLSGDALLDIEKGMQALLEAMRVSE